MLIGLPWLVASAGARAESADGEEIEVMVLEASATPAPGKARSAAVYALFVNVETTQVLIGADSPLAQRVELAGADGKRRPFGDFAFREDVETRLTPDLYLRLVGLTRALRAGETVLVRMHFEDGGHLDLHATVR